MSVSDDELSQAAIGQSSLSFLNSTQSPQQPLKPSFSSGFYMKYLESLCQRHGWPNPVYNTYTDSSRFTCRVLIGALEWETEHAYESDELARENTAFKACRNFSVDERLLGTNGIVHGILNSKRGGLLRGMEVGQSQSNDINRLGSSDSDEFSTKSEDIDYVALSGGTDNHHPWRRMVTLPIQLGEVSVNATPDTGSDGNAISVAFARELKLQVDTSSSCLASFQLANGCEIKSSGITSTTCIFRQGSNTQTAISVVFNVFARLAVPIIIGAEFLQATETLTKYTNRLVVSLCQTPRVLPRILHLNHPKKRLRCYLGHGLAYANADTGAEMNLISLAFAARRDLWVKPPDLGHRKVVLADGSCALISGKFCTRFYPFEKPPNKFSSQSSATKKDFYVLDGLTTDVLLGSDLLFEISTFSEHQNFFVDLGSLGISWT